MQCIVSIVFSCTINTEILAKLQKVILLRYSDCICKFEIHPYYLKQKSKIKCTFMGFLTS